MWFLRVIRLIVRVGARISLRIWLSRLSVNRITYRYREEGESIPVNDKTATKGVWEYNSKNANPISLCEKSTATIGPLGLGKLSSVPDITHVDG